MLLSSSLLSDSSSGIGAGQSALALMRATSTAASAWSLLAVRGEGGEGFGIAFGSTLLGNWLPWSIDGALSTRPTDPGMSRLVDTCAPDAKTDTEEVLGGNGLCGCANPWSPCCRTSWRQTGHMLFSANHFSTQWSWNACRQGSMALI